MQCRGNFNRGGAAAAVACSYLPPSRGVRPALQRLPAGCQHASQATPGFESRARLSTAGSSCGGGAF